MGAFFCYAVAFWLVAVWALVDSGIRVAQFDCDPSFDNNLDRTDFLENGTNLGLSIFILLITISPLPIELNFSPMP